MIEFINNRNCTSARTPSPLFIRGWLILLLMIFVYISMQGMYDRPYSSDEISDIFIAKGHSLKEVLGFSLLETHPPLGHILRHYWLMISEDIWFTRTQALMFGIALILLYYRIGKILAGPFTGLCFAGLVAFSQGIIIQSYIVRSYTIFLFFLSLSFYFYMRWQTFPSLKKLCAYGFFAILACLTHFSGLFSIFAIAAYETIRLYVRKARTSQQVQWIIANGLVGIVAIITYHMWQDINAAFSFATFHAAYDGQRKISPTDLFLAAAFYPLLVSSYILPTGKAIFICASTLPLAATRNKQLRSFFILSCVALAIGMLLVASGTYNALASRRSLWIFPFIIIPTGWAFAECCIWANSTLAKKRPFPLLQLISLLILLTGWASYNEKDRFSDATINGDIWEYSHTISAQALKAISLYLSSRKNHDLIVAKRSDVLLITPPGKNPYHYMEHSELNEQTFVTMPYYQSTLVFNPSYYTPPNALDILHLPSTQNALTSADTLIFLTTSWAESPIINLILCPALDKKIISFPATEPGHIFTVDEIYNTPAILLIASKKNLLEQVVSPIGKAHSCYNADGYGKR